MNFQKFAQNALAVTVLLIHTSFVQAGIILSLVSTSNSIDLSVNPVQQFVIGVRAQADTGTQDLFGYTIPVDLRNPIGTGTPPGWTVLSVARTSNFGGALYTPNLSPSEGDVSASETRTSGTPFTFTTTPVTLFEFTVQVSRNGAVDGTYVASIFNNGSLFALNNSSAGGTLPANQISTGTVSVQIVGVPEPSSLALLGMTDVLGIGISARRLNRKRHRIT